MAKYTGATWQPVGNFTEDGQEEVRGLVVHIMEGTLEGSGAWFGNPRSQASSHFGTGKDGRLWQWVDTKDRAWAQKAGNRTHLSVENEGKVPDALTDLQVKRVAALLYWAHKTHGVQLRLATAEDDRGLAWHGMKPDWGHPDCPGEAIKAQLGDILAAAKALIPKPIPPKPVAPPAPSLLRDLYYRRKDPMSGEQVTLAQKRLNYHGGKVKVDGLFGPKTLAAVKAFQAKKKLAQDGVIGKVTWKALWS